MFSMIISFHFSHILLCCFVRNTYYRPKMAIAAPPRHIPLLTEPQGFDFLEVVSTRRKCEALGLLPGQVKSSPLGKDPSGNGYRIPSCASPLPRRNPRCGLISGIVNGQDIRC
jgi:hypothetical protein